MDVKNNILGQILMGVNYILAISSNFVKYKNLRIIVDNICRCLTIGSYILLKTYDGLSYTFFTLLRNYVSLRVNKKSKKVRIIALCSLIFILTVLFGIMFNGMSTIILYVVGVINIFSFVISKNAQEMRKITLTGCPLNATFLFVTGNTAGGIGEIIGTIFLISSIIYYEKHPVIEI